MKSITPSQLKSLTDSIMDNRDKQAKVVGMPFNSMPAHELFGLIKERVGDEWGIRTPNTIKLTRTDVISVANSRFNSKTGLKLLMLLAIIVLGLALLAQYSVIPQLAYYISSFVIALVMFTIYSKKQRNARREFMEQVDIEGLEIDRGK